jgi:hypothetical protein
MVNIVREWDVNPTYRYKFSVWFLMLSRSDDGLVGEPELVNCVVYDCDLNIIFDCSTIGMICLKAKSQLLGY